MIVRRYTHQVVIPLTVICSGILLLMLVQRLSSLSVWDDAYMFVRYADNLLTYGTLAWNPNGDSTYGLTSLAYLLIVIPLRIFSPSEPAFVMILASLVSGVLVVLSMIRLLRKLVRHHVHRLAVCVMLILSIVVASDGITTHLTSGMDTLFSICALTIWINVFYTSENYGLIGVLGGLFFVVRPDMLIIVMGIVPFLLIRTSHSQFLKYALGMLTCILFQLLVTWLYFENPLPLSFYAKNIAVYSEQFYGYYTNTSEGYFVEFLLSYPYLISIIIIGWVTRFRLWQWQDKGLLLGSILFCFYHVVFVIPIMGFSQRFFYPILPIIVLLASKQLLHIIDNLPANIIDTFKNYPIRILFIPLLLLLAFINPMPIILTLVQYTQPDDAPTIGMGKFDLQTTYDYLYDDNWYGLDELSKLDDDIIIATTEVGLPSAMNPLKAIIDLAGLNHPNFALSGFSADWLMAKENQPDWIYMPFPHYEGMWFALSEHPIFKEDYQFFAAQSLGTSMDVAIKRDSIFYSDMVELFNDL